MEETRSAMRPASSLGFAWGLLLMLASYPQTHPQGWAGAAAGIANPTTRTMRVRSLRGIHASLGWDADSTGIPQIAVDFALRSTDASLCPRFLTGTSSVTAH
jgi:hypothetical protein